MYHSDYTSTPQYEVPTNQDIAQQLYIGKPSEPLIEPSLYAPTQEIAPQSNPFALNPSNVGQGGGSIFNPTPSMLERNQQQNNQKN